jgi:hypothetical protein
VCLGNFDLSARRPQSDGRTHMRTRQISADNTVG